jgi:hypothetical protein
MKIHMKKIRLKLAFQCEMAEKVLYYGEKDWTVDEYSGGCYATLFTPQVMTALKNGRIF